MSAIPAVNTRDPEAVQKAVLDLVDSRLDAPGVEAVRETLAWVTTTFAGRNPAFEALDTHYHDLEHTLQGFLCLGRILHGWTRCADPLQPDVRAIRLGLVAILLHDTGYLKPRGDRSGPGARYTLVHVQRGTEFARRHLASRGWPEGDLTAVESMIRCTGPESNPAILPFGDPILARVGCAVGSADLLGQMAAPDYLEKLPALYREFSEAIDANPGCALAQWFPDYEALESRTPAFWEKQVRVRLHGPLGNVWKYLSIPWPDGPNEYVARIEAHIARLTARRQAAAASRSTAG